MLFPSDRFIAFCWLTFFVVWIVAAFWTKRTAERAGWGSRWWIWLALAAFMLVRRRTVPFSSDQILWHAPPIVGVVADVITGVGLFIALWARMSLGTNWSGTVVFKERHELIERGPYRFVRHPIYTGVLLMMLGSVMLWSTVGAVIVFVVSAGGLSVKAWHEERWLTKHFPEAYPRYRARVQAAIIPFII